MAKRRTRKDKAGAHHQFLYTWDGEPKKAPAEASVNTQFKKSLKAQKPTPVAAKKAMSMAQVYDLASIKRSIVRSLIIASLILGTEVVIYLAWNVK